MILLQDNFYITLELLRENFLFDTEKICALLFVNET